MSTPHSKVFAFGGGDNSALRREPLTNVIQTRDKAVVAEASMASPPSSTNAIALLIKEG